MGFRLVICSAAFCYFSPESERRLRADVHFVFAVFNGVPGPEENDPQKFITRPEIGGVKHKRRARFWSL